MAVEQMLSKCTFSSKYKIILPVFEMLIDQMIMLSTTAVIGNRGSVHTIKHKPVFKINIFAVKGIGKKMCG